MVEGPSPLPAYGRGTGFVGGLGPSLGAKTFRAAEQIPQAGGLLPSPQLCVFWLLAKQQHTRGLHVGWEFPA